MPQDEVNRLLSHGGDKTNPREVVPRARFGQTRPLEYTQARPLVRRDTKPVSLWVTAVWAAPPEFASKRSFPDEEQMSASWTEMDRLRGAVRLDRYSH
jgi:hypothetical protein